MKTLLQFTGNRKPRAAEERVASNPEEQGGAPSAPAVSVVTVEAHFQALRQASPFQGILLLSHPHRSPLLRR